MTIPARVSHLLELADQGPSLRAALAEEVAELLMAWPADYPPAMRGLCESLLAQAARDGDAAAAARLRKRLAADPELTARVLPHEPPVSELIAAARGGADVAEKLAAVLKVSAAVAKTIIRDASGKSLAMAMKAAELGRCDFSALALLSHPKAERNAAYALLEIYDKVTPTEATRALRGWRGQDAAK